MPALNVPPLIVKVLLPPVVEIAPFIVPPEKVKVFVPAVSVIASMVPLVMLKVSLFGVPVILPVTVPPELVYAKVELLVTPDKSRALATPVSVPEFITVMVPEPEVILLLSSIALLPTPFARIVPPLLIVMLALLVPALKITELPELLLSMVPPSSTVKVSPLLKVCCPWVVVITISVARQVVAEMIITAVAVTN